MPDHELNFQLYISFGDADIPAIQEAHARAAANADASLPWDPDNLANMVADIINLGTELPPVWESGQGGIAANTADNPDSVKSTESDDPRTIRLPVLGITVEIVGNAGTITSNLSEDRPEMNTQFPADLSELDAAFDGIESMILAHAIAGIDVTSPAYVEGITTAVEAAANNLG